MADVATSTKKTELTFLLAADAAAEEPDEVRTLTFDISSSTDASAFKARAEAFKTQYLATYANSSVGSADSMSQSRTQAIGSLIQKSGWRDDSEDDPALACIGVKIAYIDTQRTDYDI